MAMNTPKVKMPLTQADIKAILGVPSEVEVLNVWITYDPLILTVVFASDDEFDALYAPNGGFDPTISYETVSRTFFTD
jgi:hypothetical protein